MAYATLAGWVIALTAFVIAGGVIVLWQVLTLNITETDKAEYTPIKLSASPSRSRSRTTRQFSL